MSLIALMNAIPDDDTARQWFEARRWGDAGPTCGHCGSRRYGATAHHRSMPYRCHDCHQYFSVRLGSVMQASKLGLRTWLLALCLLSSSSKGMSSVQLAKHLGVTQKTAWHLGRRIRAAWESGSDPLMTGPVEVDEVFIGGKASNRHKDEHRPRRGPRDKEPIMGAAGRSTGEVSLRHTPRVTSGTASRFVTMRAEPGSTVFTDEAAHCARLPGFGYVHETVNHRRGEYGRGVVSTNWIESVWALLRRGVVGVCHFMSAKHPQRCVTELEARCNATRRHASLEDAAAGMFGRTLTYERLTEPTWPTQLVLW